MNVIFAVVFLGAALVFLLADPEGFLPAMLAGGEKAASVCLALLASYCVWLGFFQVLEKCGLSRRLARALYPAARRLFRSEDRQALALACQNIAANLLGLPGAPTPLGVAATQKFLAAQNGYAAAKEPKELYTVADAEHIGRYDRRDRIPFDKLAEFFSSNLK